MLGRKRSRRLVSRRGRFACSGRRPVGVPSFQPRATLVMHLQSVIRLTSVIIAIAVLCTACGGKSLEDECAYIEDARCWQCGVVKQESTTTIGCDGPACEQFCDSEMPSRYRQCNDNCAYVAPAPELSACRRGQHDNGHVVFGCRCPSATQLSTIGVRADGACAYFSTSCQAAGFQGTSAENCSIWLN